MFVKYGKIFGDIEFKNSFQNKPIQIDQLDNFIKTYLQDFKSFSKIINSTFEFNLEEDKTDYKTVATLHPAFLKYFTPFKTPADGNCLWHMISICLCGNISLSNILRGK